MVRHANVIKEIAQQRIEHLFWMAECASHDRPDLANRYVSMAVRIARRTRMRLPIHMKRRFCKSCGAFLMPGKTARVRISSRRSRHQTVTCLKCGHVARHSLSQKTVPVLPPASQP